MKKYKTWGGLIFNDGQQVRCIVATKTKKKALELLKLKSHYFNNYWCETHNKTELEIALNNPEKLFISKEHFSNNKHTYFELGE